MNPALTATASTHAHVASPKPKGDPRSLLFWLCGLLAVCLLLSACAGTPCDIEASQDYWELTAPEHADYIRDDAALTGSEKDQYLTSLRLRAVELELAGATLDPSARRSVFAPVEDPESEEAETDAESD